MPEDPTPVAYTRRQEEPENYKDAGVVARVHNASASGHHWTYHLGWREHVVAGAAVVAAAAAVVATALFSEAPQWLILLLSVGVALAYGGALLGVFLENTSAPDQPVVRLHHYYLRSREEFIERRDMDMRHEVRQGRELLGAKFDKRDAELDQVTDRRAIPLWDEMLAAEQMAQAVPQEQGKQKV